MVKTIFTDSSSFYDEIHPVLGRKAVSQPPIKPEKAERAQFWIKLIVAIFIATIAVASLIFAFAI